jgi:adenylate kinase
MRKFVIMGPQGSGKGTQAKLLCEACDVVHISVGDIFRWHVQKHTKLGAKVKRIVAEGRLVPDELVDEVVSERLAQHDWNYGFLLDGFPRNFAQAEFFLEAYDIDAVLHLDVPRAVVRARILSRRLCLACGLDYNLIHHRPAVADTCDVCRAPLVQRPDDSPEAVEARLDDYEAKTRPVLELFRRKEYVLDLDGTRAPAAIQAEIRARLGHLLEGRAVPSPAETHPLGR